MDQVKTQQPPHSNAKTEIAVISSVAAAWVAVMTQVTSITNPIAWLVPCGIIAVYLLFRLWAAAPVPRKPKQTEENQPLWWQLAIQMLTFYVLYFMTTAPLRGSIDGYNEWYSLIIAIAYFFAVPMALNRFVWPKLPAANKHIKG